MFTPRTSRVRLRRRWFQFRLRSLLLLMTAASVACAWWLRPVPREIVLVDGVLIRLEETRSSTDDQDLPTYVRWQLITAEGQRVARGTTRGDLPHGRFAAYHANGRVAIEGAYHHGRPVGAWQSWSAEGRRLAEWQAEPDGEANATLQVWWPDGSLRIQGGFRAGREHGEWTSHDRRVSVNPTASGSYRDGRRHGWWTCTDPATAERQQMYYAHGLPLPDIQDDLTRLSVRLRAGHLAERLSAARCLARLGPAGAETLGEILDQADEQTAVLVLKVLAEMGDDAESALPAVGRQHSAESPRVRLYARLATFSIDASDRSRKRQPLLAAAARFQPAAAVDAMAMIVSVDPDSQSAVSQQLMTLLGRTEGWNWLLVELGVESPAVLTLLQGALDDPDAAVRSRVIDLMIAYRYAAETLGLNTPDYRWTLASLLRKASDDPDPKIRDLARALSSGPPRGGGAFGGSGGAASPGGIF